jgi:hypothetical protein
MTTSARKTAKPTAKTAVKTVATTARRPAESVKQTANTEPSLRFHVSKQLQAKTDAVLAALEAAPDAAGHGDAVAQLVAELTEVGMDYYYLKALRLAQVGFVAEQSARLGLSGAARIISSVSRKYIVRMDQDQLLVVARHIRELGSITPVKR